MLMYTLALSCLTTSNLPWFMDLPFQVPMQYYSLQYQTLLITSHIHNWVLFLLWLCLFILSAVISKLISTGHLLTWSVHLSMSYLFAFSYYSWDSQGRNSEVVCHCLLQWTTFYQNSPPLSVCLEWPYTAWLIVSFLVMLKKGNNTNVQEKCNRLMNVVYPHNNMQL